MKNFLLCYMIKQFVTKIGMLVPAFLILLGCKSNPFVESQPAIFIDNRDSSFFVIADSSDTVDCLIYVIRKPVLRYTEDSIFLLSTNYKYYYLEHYLKYNDYHDDTFIKHASILDRIAYKNKTWLEVEDNLDSLWLSVCCSICGSIYDTMKIWLIEPSTHSDSLIFRQVHRQFHQTQ